MREATGLKAKWLELWATGRIQPFRGLCFLPSLCTAISTFSVPRGKLTPPAREVRGSSHTHSHHTAEAPSLFSSRRGQVGATFSLSCETGERATGGLEDDGKTQVAPRIAFLAPVPEL